MTRGPIDLKVVGDALGTVAECLEGCAACRQLGDLEDLGEELRRAAARAPQG